MNGRTQDGQRRDDDDMRSAAATAANGHMDDHDARTRRGTLMSKGPKEAPRERERGEQAAPL